MMCTTKGMFAASHAIELGIVFLAIIFTGAGSYSIDARLAGRPTE